VQLLAEHHRTLDRQLDGLIVRVQDGDETEMRADGIR
jgi:hypothetical protein